MMFEILDDDTYEIIPENFQVAQNIERQIWIGHRTLIIVKYLGINNFGKHAFVSGNDVKIEIL